jgi:hypothetical protein
MFSEFSFWEWLDIFGLFIVTVGCAMEFWMLFKKQPYNPTNFRSLNAEHVKWEGVAGFVVVFGLACEFVALPISLMKSHREISEANRQLDAMNPLRQPVMSVSAVVLLSFPEGSTTTNRNIATKYCAVLRASRVFGNGTTNSFRGWVDLHAEQFDAWGGAQVNMDMESGSFEKTHWPLQGTSGDLFANLDAVELTVFFLKNEATNCNGGFVIITINSALTKRFEIPAQPVMHHLVIYGSYTNNVIFDPKTSGFSRVNKTGL